MFSAMRSLGILNVETPDISELMSHEPAAVEAYCNSLSCAGSDRHSRSLGVRKFVPRQRSFCVECGAALFWRKRPKYE